MSLKRGHALNENTCPIRVRGDLAAVCQHPSSRVHLHLLATYLSFCPTNLHLFDSLRFPTRRNPADLDICKRFRV
jgi:hypothetical protein